MADLVSPATTPVLLTIDDLSSHLVLGYDQVVGDGWQLFLVFSHREHFLLEVPPENKSLNVRLKEKIGHHRYVVCSGNANNTFEYY